ncbi:MAG TPA: tRNA (adenosine(37)-N6)-threonylcarbamoyltransferase complex ATPase subunit type 1 TsaE [Thermomicrobiaceae bacterium]|nr:tRNA (adenosine(37)-N6)-threonylcarbamoyltransferase complex ATPase subunit type 1 TsaE [Thermomicrobiaceae bacterium]
MTARRPALDLISHSPDQTRWFGSRLGRLLRRQDVILLSGRIGAGKTVLVQGVARGLGIDDYIQSPTFTLANEHRGRLASGEPVMLYHLDLYRLEDQAELATFGYDEYIDASDGVVILEWPDRLGADRPSEYLLIGIEYLADTKRRLTFYPTGARFERLVSEFRTEAFGAQRRTAPAGD